MFWGQEGVKELKANQQMPFGSSENLCMKEILQDEDHSKTDKEESGPSLSSKLDTGPQNYHKI